MSAEQGSSGPISRDVREFMRKAGRHLQSDVS